MLPFTAQPWESCFKSIKLNFLISIEILFYFILFIYFQRAGKGGRKKGRKGREKERERNINVWLPLVHPQLGS